MGGQLWNFVQDKPFVYNGLYGARKIRHLAIAVLLLEG